MAQELHSAPRIAQIDGLADTDHLTSTTVMDLGVVPASLLVLGGGYVALMRTDPAAPRPGRAGA